MLCFSYRRLSKSHFNLLPLRHLRLSAASTSSIPVDKDAYFTLVNHITNIVRTDIYPERTLNKLNIPLTSELVYRVLRACSHSPSESFRFFTWARAHYCPTTVEYEELIKTLASAKQYSSMWRLITQMRERHKNSNEFSISSETVCFIIEEYGKHGLVDKAVEIFNRCSSGLNCKQSVEVYNSLLFALCEVKMFHGAYALIRRMIRKGVVLDKRTYGVLVNGWCSNEMSKKGFNPPVRGRDLLVEGLLNAGYLESAKNLVLRMTRRVFPQIVCRLGFYPDINSYKILMAAASKESAIEDGHRPFPSLYAPIIKGMCRRGQFNDAFCFFSEMKVKGHPPNRPVYTMLITMCGRGGRYVDAANYLVEMTEMGLRPISRCFDLVTDGLKNCGKYDLAKRIEHLELSLRRN
ncbi:hypothetical protein K2173_014526 [Erythroxylum novogranatense]|uniref:Pentatricopeptide repeat-containing protein n=1 Tax=Erythroxylum novogranatense TaxID=1862640 RepID=A0AAV8S6C7_9ROSI|nr:hypothetical protein K2173_014526 [Erythroxylum novogranatense]